MMRLNQWVVAISLCTTLHVGWSQDCATGQETQTNARDGVEPEHYYLASLAAAEKSIRLGEVANARRWLDAAHVELRGWEWSFLRGQLDESVLKNGLDSESTTAIAVSSDGRWVATSDSEGKIQLRNSRDLQVVREVGNHSGAIYSLAFSPDSRWLASVSRDETSRVWDVESGNELSRIKLDNPGVAATTFSPDGKQVATCTWLMEGQPRTVHGVVWIWDSATGEIIHRELIGIKPLDSIAWSSDGETIVVGSWDGIVHVLNKTGVERSRLTVPDEGLYTAVIAVGLNRDATLVACGSKDHTVRVWDLSSGELVHTLRQHNGYVNKLSFSPVGNLLATACEDSIVRIWDLQQARLEPKILIGHQRSVDGVSWAPDGKRIYSVARDQTIRTWDADKSYGRRLVINVADEGTYSTTFTPDGKQIYVAGHSGYVWNFDTVNGNLVDKFEAHAGSSCNLLSIDHSGKRMLTCSWDKTGKLWSLPKHELIGTFDAGDGIYSCALSPDGRLAALAIKKNVQIWDTDSGEKAGELTGHLEAIRGVAFSKDGSLIATASEDKTAGIWDSKTFERVHSLQGHNRPVNAVAFSGVGNQLASGDNGGNVRVWNADATLYQNIQASDRSIERLAYAPDGRRIAAGTLGVTILNPNVSEPLVNFKPVADSVWFLMFSPNGRELAACSTGGQISICFTTPEPTKEE